MNSDSMQRVAVVGAGGAIGEAFCRALLDKPSIQQVFALGRHPAPLAEISEKVVPVAVNIRDEASIQAAVEHIDDNRLDAVIIASGMLHDDAVSPEKRLAACSSEAMHQLFDVNAVAPLLLSKHLAAKLKRNAEAKLAILSARVGSISDNRAGGWYAYRASKAAVNMVIKCMSIELGRQDKSLTVVGLHPGTVDSRLSAPYQANVKPGKLFSPAQSAGYLLSVLDGLDSRHTGRLFAWDGEEIAP
ncbi:SDR family NAD(P)-dependent oxidoreductase [Salinivibrio kushneri]|uniref:SDR family NAD(P)-dependent oxidoreductase n=1 Tax=Salinivibrio kushneri TaxID=1908198 RepID=A0AA47KNK5_9GAMM|nr:SDR family NAD(P)-dependent oxidoreductase [Salinivibrio kushneri]WBA10255.1 SDR family NAD(P)-dependent oxidoreductase [Salinivibrio kushneri]